MIQKGFVSLAPLHAQKLAEADLAAALRILCPPHPTEPQRYVQRAGRNKRGHVIYYFTLHGRVTAADWRDGEELSGTRYREIRQLIESGVIEVHAGPTTYSQLFYHKDEEANPKRGV